MDWYPGKILSQLGSLVFPMAAVAPADARFGFAGHGPSSTSNLQRIIDEMTSRASKVYRMSFSPQWEANNYNPAMVQYFLDHTPSDWVVIVDRNHTYPSNETEASQFRANLSTARSNILGVCAAWPNNPRAWVELGNEYVSSDFQSVFQGLINSVRNAGYHNTLVMDKWNTSWSTAKFTDPDNNVFTGMHFYFNSWSPTGAQSQMQTAINMGLKLINTEIGADYRENNYYTSGTVGEVNTFLAWCKTKGVGNCVWLNHNYDNLPRYEQLGLKIPVSGPSATPTPPPPTGAYTLGIMGRTTSGSSGNLAGISFAITGVGSYKTNAYPKLNAGSYEVVMPASATVSGRTYSFKYWGKTGTGSTNRVRTVSLASNTYLDATYG